MNDLRNEPKPVWASHPAAIEIRRERVIVVPIDVLWQIVEGAETVPHWLPLCERCELLSGAGLGRRQRMYARWGRRIAEIDQEVVEYTPRTRLTWRHTTERMDGRRPPQLSKDVWVSVELHAVGAGTQVSLTAAHVPNGALGKWMLRFVGAPRIGKAFDRALANLAGSGEEGP